VISVYLLIRPSNHGLNSIRLTQTHHHTCTGSRLIFFGINAIRTIKIDIFPSLNLPVLYLSHPFGGYTPSQMEAYFGKPYVNLMLFVSGVKSIETRNIQGLTLMKLTFYEGTNMAQAAAEVSTFSNRAQAIFPQGSNPPFIIRFDASTLP